MSKFQLKNIPSQKGRIAIVTGANIGLGYETALALAQKEMKVIMACRTLAKAEKAKENILKEFPTANLEILLIDLGSLASVKKFASQFLAKNEQLDLLINNAGIMVPPFYLTEDGFESQMAANYFGHFLLTGLLLDVITTTPNSRIVSLSSIAHRSGKINFDDLQGKKKYSATKSYSQSKLACLMFAYELQRKLDKTGSSTISVAAHPGASNTNLVKHLPSFAKVGFDLLGPLFSNTPAQGAEATLLAALGEEVRGGQYFGPNGFKEIKGRAVKVDSTSLSKNKKIAAQLWTVSEELTHYKYNFK